MKQSKIVVLDFCNNIGFTLCDAIYTLAKNKLQYINKRSNIEVSSKVIEEIISNNDSSTTNKVTTVKIYAN